MRRLRSRAALSVHPSQKLHRFDEKPFIFFVAKQPTPYSGGMFAFRNPDILPQSKWYASPHRTSGRSETQLHSTRAVFAPCRLLCENRKVATAGNQVRDLRGVLFAPESGQVQCNTDVRFGPNADIALFNETPALQPGSGTVLCAHSSTQNAE